MDKTKASSVGILEISDQSNKSKLPQRYHCSVWHHQGLGHYLEPAAAKPAYNCTHCLKAVVLCIAITDGWDSINCCLTTLVGASIHTQATAKLMSPLISQADDCGSWHWRISASPEVFFSFAWHTLTVCSYENYESTINLIKCKVWRLACNLAIGINMKWQNKCPQFCFKE